MASTPDRPVRRRRIAPASARSVEVAPPGPASLDLLRADLYRLLDEVARTRGPGRDAAVLEFERTWSRFKEALAGRR
jgi:hypothetical protein